MIPSLLLLLLRRFQKKYPEQAALLLSKFRAVARMAFLLLISICIALDAFAQERVLHYTILRNGSAIGTLTLKEHRQNQRVTYNLQSAIKTSFLFTLTGRVLEEAVYDNGILTYSRFYQKLNNNERVNSKIEADGKNYTVSTGTEATALNKYPITYNMVCLYSVEPLHRTTIFADKFRQFIPIKTIRPHHYKIKFPDGNYNEYYYKGGICIKVKLNSTWFSAEMHLKN